ARLSRAGDFETAHRPTTSRALRARPIPAREHRHGEEWAAGRRIPPSNWAGGGFRVCRQGETLERAGASGEAVRAGVGRRLDQPRRPAACATAGEHARTLSGGGGDGRVHRSRESACDGYPSGSGDPAAGCADLPAPRASPANALSTPAARTPSWLLRV